MRIASLLAAPGSTIDPAVAVPVDAVGPALASLTDAEMSAVCERAAHLREVLTGIAREARSTRCRASRAPRIDPGRR